MVCFIYRSTFVKAVTTGAAVMMLCTMPSPVVALPIEARLAKASGFTEHVARGLHWARCEVVGCHNAVVGAPNTGLADPVLGGTEPSEPAADATLPSEVAPPPTPSSTTDAAPEETVAPAPDVSTDDQEKCEVVGCHYAVNPSPTSGAFGRGADLSPLMALSVAAVGVMFF